LAKLFYASRAAVGERAAFSEDPTNAAIKHTDMIAAIRLAYERMAGESLDEKASPELSHLWQSVVTVLSKAMKGEYKGRWADHPNFPGRLIPARFGNLVTNEYNALANSKSMLRWTTSDEYLVNVSAKADAWEQHAIKAKFKDPKWQQGESYFELVKAGSDSTYRYAMPEYFKSSCMNCHGGEMGKRIHQGKNAAGTGTFGGILSVQLKK
jgi:mono/diheme cytochrome c family protein